MELDSCLETDAKFDLAKTNAESSFAGYIAASAYKNYTPLEWLANAGCSA